MTGLFRRATMVAGVATLLGAGAARAVIDPGNCSLSDTRINLVGYYANASDAANAADSIDYRVKFTVIVRNIAHNPIAGVPVVLDFSGCPDVKLAATQSYHAMTVDCAAATVQGFSTHDGSVSFVVIGGASTRAGHAAGSVKVYGDFFFLGFLSIGTYDQNNTGGMSLADISLFWGDVGTTQDRSDLDGNGIVSLADLSFAWGAESHPFTNSAASVCP